MPFGGKLVWAKFWENQTKMSKKPNISEWPCTFARQWLLFLSPSQLMLLHPVPWRIFLQTIQSQWYRGKRASDREVVQFSNASAARENCSANLTSATKTISYTAQEKIELGFPARNQSELRTQDQYVECEARFSETTSGANIKGSRPRRAHSQRGVCKISAC